MGKVLVFMGGVIAGAILGGAAALLLTPQSGDSLRGQARQRYENAVVAGRKAADERKQQLINEYGDETRRSANLPQGLTRNRETLNSPPVSV
jgi:gas vesicle protein